MQIILSITFLYVNLVTLSDGIHNIKCRLRSGM